MLVNCEIKTKNLLIRSLQQGDESYLLEYYKLNYKHLSEFISVDKSCLTLDKWESHIQSKIEVMKKGEGLFLHVFSQEKQNKLVGCVNYSQIFRGFFQACYLGYHLSQKFEGKGYMRESLEAANSYIFNEVGLHRIMANYQPTNEKSGHLLKKLGLTVEGFARDYLLVNGKWRDHILTSLCNRG